MTGWDQYLEIPIASATSSLSIQQTLDIRKRLASLQHRRKNRVTQ